MTATSPSASSALAVYLDTSAALKLIKPEAETGALRAFLTAWPRRISSRLITVEMACAADRYGLDRQAVAALLGGVRLLPVTPEHIDGACRSFTPPQRALDALHLSAALMAADVLAYFVTYDDRQSRAARNAGLAPVAPA